MKILFALLLVSSVGYAASETSKGTKAGVAVTKEKAQAPKILKDLDKKEEDCDEKAKKPIEIVPESISLGGGNAGCTLE